MAKRKNKKGKPHNKTKKSKRLNWDEFYLLIAAIYSVRATCDRLLTATILVDKNHRIVAAGYNGSVSGTEHCDDVGHLIVNDHCLRTLHSEVNATLNAVGGLEDTTAYMVTVPCVQCVKQLLQAGVKRIVYIGHYNNSKGFKEIDDYIVQMCKKIGVSLERFSDNPIVIKDLFSRATKRLEGPGGVFSQK